VPVCSLAPSHLSHALYAWDKDSKVNYLNKIITCVGLALGQHVPARPLKVVAGLEPENTNEFLQMLARAATEGDGQDAVRRVLGGESAPSEASGGGGSGAPPPPPVQRERTPPPPVSPEPEPEPAAPPPQAAPAPPAPVPVPAPAAAREEFTPPPESGGGGGGGGAGNGGGASRGDEDEEAEVAPRRAPARPQSARRAPPKIASKVTEVDKKEEMAVLRQKQENEKKAVASASLGPTILGEGDNGPSDDDDDEPVAAPPSDGSSGGTGIGRRSTEQDPEGGGALVRDMLAAGETGRERERAHTASRLKKTPRSITYALFQPPPTPSPPPPMTCHDPSAHFVPPRVTPLT